MTKAFSKSAGGASSLTAYRTFQLENSVRVGSKKDRENYAIDEDEQNRLRADKPWTKECVALPHAHLLLHGSTDRVEPNQSLLTA